jgi:hypothetical protein
MSLPREMTAFLDELRADAEFKGAADKIAEVFEVLDRAADGNAEATKIFDVISVIVRRPRPLNERVARLVEVTPWSDDDWKIFEHVDV